MVASLGVHFLAVVRRTFRSLFQCVLTLLALARPAAKFSDSKRADKYHAYNKGPADEEILNAVEKIAKSKGVPMVHVALSWILSKSYVTAPIVGAKTTDRIDEIIGALKVKLSEEEVNAIEKEYRDQPIKGHSGLSDGVNFED